MTLVQSEGLAEAELVVGKDIHSTIWGAALSTSGMPGGVCRNLGAGETECEAPRPAPQMPCAFGQRLLGGCYGLVAWQLLSALSHAAKSPYPLEVFLTP